MSDKISSLEQIIEKARSGKKKRIVVAAAADEFVLSAINAASAQNFIEPVLVGDEQSIFKIVKEKGFYHSGWEIINEEDPLDAIERSLEIIKNGRGDIMMKGMVSTAPLLKGILNKENGLKKKELLSHVALFSSSYYHKLFCVTDAGMNIAPGTGDKANIIKNAVEIFNKLGHPCPKVAVLAPVEVVNEKIQSTVDAKILKEMNQKGEIGNCIIDGPFALDNAVSAEAARHKNIDSAVAGDADILFVPDINSGNILYKSLVFLSDARSAAIISGAKIPLVLTSRADNEISKLNSIALAALI